MSQKLPPLNAILWFARIWALLILSFVGYFVVAHIAGPDDGAGAALSNFDILQFSILIPALAGMVLGLKWYGAGGALSTLAFLCYALIRPDLALSPLYFVFAGPGLVNLVVWYFRRRWEQGSETP